MTDATLHLLGLCSTAVPTTDGPPAQAPDGPHAILYGGTPNPASLDLAHHYASTWRVWRIVCVNNTANGARLVADRIIRAVESRPSDLDVHAHHQIANVSDPIEDRDDPSQWRWSATVEIHLTTRRHP